ncbi:hypothetical protein OPV22_030108 [Ensete ventricosum]|uniref:Uncharacterized protein n=1 Tax=Ensete ventricosum TaxID=4639 RepID=A0AAV8QD90_ENSVE|nr:hypothetical protein OPV22_030108 [Ensete ventricosum]
MWQPDAAGDRVEGYVAGYGTPLHAYVFALFTEKKKAGPSSDPNYDLFEPGITSGLPACRCQPISPPPLFLRK